MKKILSIVLAAFMLISTFSALAVSASADTAGEGNWVVLLDAFQQSTLEENPNDVTISTPGYEYSSDGFTIVPPTYKNSQAKFTAISKAKYDATNFSIKIRVDNFDVSGDAWMSFSFWSELNGLAQGGNSDGTYGYGWSCLIRDAENFGVKDGMFSRFEGFSSGTPSTPGGWNTVGDIDFTPNLVDGKQVLELKVVDKIIYINGEAVPTSNNTALNNAFRNDQGLAYFGISVKSGTMDAPVKFTILEVNGAKPTGSDSAEPVNRGKTYGDMIDSSTIAANTPGILFDGTLRAQNSKLPSTSICTSTLTEDGNIQITANSSLGSVGFIVNSDYTLEVKDFPYVAIVLKNFCTCGALEEGVPMEDTCSFSEQCIFYYAAGDAIAPDEDHKIALDGDRMVVVTPEGSDDYYVIFYAKIDTTEYEGEESRIHSLRFDFSGTTTNQTFDIVYAGFFAGVSDMVNYATGRDEGFVLSVEDISFDQSGGLVDDNTGDEEDEGPEDLEDTTTKAPASVSTSTSASSGCGSFVGMGVVAIVAISSVAGVVTFTKKRRS